MNRKLNKSIVWNVWLTPVRSPAGSLLRPLFHPLALAVIPLCSQAEWSEARLLLPILPSPSLSYYLTPISFCLMDVSQLGPPILSLFNLPLGPYPSLSCHSASKAGVSSPPWKLSLIVQNSLNTIIYSHLTTPYFLHASGRWPTKRSHFEQ